VAVNEKRFAAAFFVFNFIGAVPYLNPSLGVKMLVTLLLLSYRPTHETTQKNSILLQTNHSHRSFMYLIGL
jgi:hypothetical protein